MADSSVWPLARLLAVRWKIFIINPINNPIMRKVNILAAVCLFSVAAMAQQPTPGIRQLTPSELGRAQHAAPATLAPQALPQGGGIRLSAPLKAEAPQARAEALGEGERYVGYFSNSDMLSMGFELSSMSAATFYDPDICRKYTGDQVTRLSATFTGELLKCTLWLSETLGGPRLAEAEIPAGSLPSAQGGTVEAVLDAPYTITADGFYIGYDVEMLAAADQPAQYYPLAFNADGTMGSGTALLSSDGTLYDDLTSYYASSYGYVLVLGMQACVQSQNHSDYDLALLDFESMTYLLNAGDLDGQGQYPATILGSVMNYGSETVDGFDLIVYCNGEPYGTLPFETDGGIASFKGGRFAVTVPVLSSFSLASFSFEVGGLAGGSTDQYEANNSAELPLMRFYEPEQAVAKTPLLELYTTGQCVNCPYGHAVVSAAAATSHPAIVAHHVGFYEDDYTMQESYTYMYEFGVGGAPSAVADRAWNAYDGAYVFSTGYTNAAAGGEVVNQYLSEAGAFIPAFATITAVPSYDADTRTLTVNVSGTKSDADLFDYVMTAPRVHAYLTEDGLVGDQIRPGGLRGSYVDASYVHDHVLRTVLGEDAAWGVAPVWYDDTYTATFTATLDPEWVPENMNIVVFLTNEDSESLWNHAVMNAAQVNLSGEDTGLSTAPAGEGFAAWGGEGRVCLSGDFRSFRVYTLQGAEVPASGLAPGIYVVAVDTESGTQVRKVAVR